MAKLSLILLLTPAVLVGTSAAAAAETADNPHSVAVQYHDLNLANAEGRTELNARVKSAVKTVCGSRHSVRWTLADHAVVNRCEAAAQADADVKLTALFNGNGARLADRGTIVVAAAP